jgi:glycosyltransferase involved in cell wall biosynthesis
MEDGMRVLALVDTPDHVCCRYRIAAFASALDRAGWELSLQSFHPGLAGRITQLCRADRYDATIVQRKLLPRWQFGLLRKRARRLIFDFDDAVLFRDSYHPRGPYCPRRAARFAAMVSGADLVIAGNEFLAGCAARAGAGTQAIAVIPTCVNVDAYRPIWRAEPTTALDLVWIGSSSTLQGLERQRPLWDRIGRAVDGVRLSVICDRFPDLGAMPVVKVPWSEATEAAALAAADVGISWIPDDLWSRGKCGLKVLQYQAAGLPVVANPVGVHPALIDHGRTGFLADTDDAWVEAIRALADDPHRRRRMGAAARVALAANYSVEAWADRFVAAVTGTATGQSVTSPLEHSPSSYHEGSELPMSSPPQFARPRGRAGTVQAGNS